MIEFNTRLTHAYLMAIIIILTHKDWYGLHSLIVILLCFAWAYYITKVSTDERRGQAMK